MPSFEIDTREYQFSHGKAPRGRGWWMFEFKRFGVKVGECQCRNDTYTEARKHAQQVAKTISGGVTTIKVMP